MPTIAVIPTIEPLKGGFVLCAKSFDGQRAWRKWYGNKRAAYVDAAQIGLARHEYFGSTHRRRLEVKISIETERLERFGLRETEV